jgi:hypothetical protein
MATTTVRALICISALVLMSGSASATPIRLTVDTADMGPRVGAYEVDFSFGTQLNGIVLSGQTLSLEFTFEDDILAEVPGGIRSALGFGVSLSVATTANAVPGFAGNDSTGYLLGGDGSAMSGVLPPDRVGRWMSSSGAFGVGLFPGPLIDGFRMSGVYYELVLPATGYAITGGKIRLSSSDPWGRLNIGTVAQLPEPGVPIWLLAATMSALVYGSRRGRSRLPSVERDGVAAMSVAHPVTDACARVRRTE